MLQLLENKILCLHILGVSKIFCGHYHRNAGGFDGEIELIVTSAIGCQVGDDTHGCRVVKVMDSTITHKYFAIENLPEKVDLTTPEFNTK